MENRHAVRERGLRARRVRLARSMGDATHQGRQRRLVSGRQAHIVLRLQEFQGGDAGGAQGAAGGAGAGGGCGGGAGRCGRRRRRQRRGRHHLEVADRHTRGQAQGFSLHLEHPQPSRRRSSSALEGYHLHYRAAQHPCAKHTGYKLETARSNLFDFAWNVHAAERAGHLRRHGHCCLWLDDALARLTDGWLTCGSEAEPPTLVGFRRTRTDVAPMTTRGIDWEQLKALNAVGAQSIGLSTLQSREEQQAVLAHPSLMGAGDAAGIERATGIRTSSMRLLALAARACMQAACDATLNAAGAVALGEVLHRTAGNAPPRSLQRSAAPRAAAAGAAGPLPFDAGQAGGSSGYGVVAPPPLPAAADHVADTVDDDDGMHDDDDDGMHDEDDGMHDDDDGMHDDADEGDADEGDTNEGDGGGTDDPPPPYDPKPNTSEAYKAWYARNIDSLPKGTAEERQFLHRRKATERERRSKERQDRLAGDGGVARKATVAQNKRSSGQKRREQEQQDAAALLRPRRR